MIPRRVIMSNGFPAIISPGPRGTRTVALNVGLNAGLGTSLMITASPSTSHLTVIYHSSGNR